MSVEQRIKLVNELVIQHDKLYEPLGDYTGFEYTTNFYNYLVFLNKNVGDVRLDLAKIYREMPDYKFETKNYQLIGGKNKTDFKKNVRQRLYLPGDYKKYLNEAEKYFNEQRSYAKPPHRKVGKGFKKTASVTTSADEFKDAKKAYSKHKSKYKNYVGRLKAKIAEMKVLKKEYIYWKKFTARRKKGPPRVDKTGKPIKEMVLKEGLNNEEIEEEFDSIKTRLNLEIKSLKKLKFQVYQKYRVSRARYKKLKKQFGPTEGDE